jgi:hypothetical protein
MGSSFVLFGRHAFFFFDSINPGDFLDNRRVGGKRGRWDWSRGRGAGSAICTFYIK